MTTTQVEDNAMTLEEAHAQCGAPACDGNLEQWAATEVVRLHTALKDLAFKARTRTAMKHAALAALYPPATQR